MHVSNLFKILIRIVGILGVGIGISLLIALYYNESILPFIETLVVCICFALVFKIFIIRSKPKDVSKKESFLIVTLSWFFIAAVGSLPYIFSNSFSLIDALFESTSGFSTTGSSILSDIEALPKSLLFWRSLTHWIGGIGIIVIVIIIMPSLKIGGNNLFSVESSVGEKILPKITSVGKRLLLIYVSLTILEIIFLLFGNMSLFESVCHSFGTVATGGFSPKNTSIFDYSPYIQYVIAIFMLLAGINFILYYYLVNNRLDKIKKNDELWFYLKFIGITTCIVTAILFFQTDRPLEQSFRDSFFQVVSIVTCTGFGSSDYLLWPQAGWVIMFLLLFTGGCTGSTAGGIKMARHALIFKNLRNIFTKNIHSNAITTVRFNNQIMNEKQNLAVLTFITSYFIVFLIGTILLIIFHVDGKTAASSIASAMGGVGPGIGTVGPASNFGHLPNIVKIIISLFMIIGRLELYAFLVLLSPAYWRS